MKEESAVLEIRNVWKRYGDYEAVKNLNITVKKGEFFSIVGPSGCGKTTTLKMIAGFEYPSEGSILLAGQQTESLPPFKRNVNTVFQNYALFPHMNVYKNVAYPLTLKKVSQDELDRRVRESLEMVSMGPFVKRYPHELSGGQKQRIALARALVSRPELLLLDEPLSALDFHLRQEMQKVLKHLQKEVGITFVYITHDQGEALSLSNRVAVMEKGVLHQVGTPEHIYERPETRFVAGFIGKTNLLGGMVASPHEIQVLQGNVLTTKSLLPYKAGESVFLSIRPERISLQKKDERYTNRIRARFIEDAYYGSEKELSLAMADGTPVLVRVTDQNASVDVVPDTEMDLYFKPEDVIVVKE
ncbi:UNVERIFIED_CONTAM: spermidine/putrescine transport system ATP-binding protein [Brevibacillus sp. OAP136]